jgi:hypothetical protein
MTEFGIGDTPENDRQRPSSEDNVPQFRPLLRGNADSNTEPATPQPNSAPLIVAPADRGQEDAASQYPEKDRRQIAAALAVGDVAIHSEQDGQPENTQDTGNKSPGHSITDSSADRAPVAPGDSGDKPPAEPPDIHQEAGEDPNDFVFDVERFNGMNPGTKEEQAEGYRTFLAALAQTKQAHGDYADPRVEPDNEPLETLWTETKAFDVRAEYHSWITSSQNTTADRGLIVEVTDHTTHTKRTYIYERRGGRFVRHSEAPIPADQLSAAMTAHGNERLATYNQNRKTEAEMGLNGTLVSKEEAEHIAEGLLRSQPLEEHASDLFNLVGRKALAAVSNKAQALSQSRDAAEHYKRAMKRHQQKDTPAFSEAIGTVNGDEGIYRVKTVVEINPDTEPQNPPLVDITLSYKPCSLADTNSDVPVEEDDSPFQPQAFGKMEFRVSEDELWVGMHEGSFDEDGNPAYPSDVVWTRVGMHESRILNRLLRKPQY